MGCLNIYQEVTVMELPTTNQRVANNTPDAINQEIQAAIKNSIAYYQSHPALISARLKQLDEEWDIERILEANASTLIVAGSALGFALSKKFFAIPIIVGAFLFQHALQGWCPPLPILRRLGCRTASEIQDERAALENIVKQQRQKHH